MDRKGTRYEKYAEALEPEEVKNAFFDGDPRKEGTAIYDKPRDQKGKRIGTVIGGKPVKGFATPSGKVEFVSSWLREKKDATGKPVDSRPVYEAREWQPSKDYPLYLINWKEANHTHTRTQNNPWLLEIKPENPLIIDPATARAFGVADGDLVWIESPHGKAQARVRTTRRMHPEVVGVQHGFGHTALGRLAKGPGHERLAAATDQVRPAVGPGHAQGSARSHREGMTRQEGTR